MAIISPLKKIFNWQTASEKIPYKVYTASLGQTGTDVPVAEVLENTIGNITFTRISPGGYQINLPYKVKGSKIFIPGFGSWSGSANPYIVIWDGTTVVGYVTLYPYDYDEPTDKIYIESIDNTGIAIELSSLINTTKLYFEFRVYN